MMREVHAQFCKRFYELPYELFEDDWRQTAKTILRLNAEPDEYFNSMLLVSSERWTDPFDIHGPAAVARYKEQAAQVWRGEVWAYVNGRRQLEQLMAINNITDAGDILRRAPCYNLDHVFTITEALKVMNPPEASEVIERHGEWALKTLKRNHLLRRYMAEREGRSPENLIRLIEEVLELVDRDVDHDETPDGT